MKFILKALAGTVLALGAQWSLAQQVRLMPLGDSITAGIGTADGNGYRLPLWNQLVGEVSSLNFVGTNQVSGDMSDNDNEGHPGWTIDELGSIATGVLLQYQPNLVTLHIGTNDVARNDNVATAPDRLSALIDQVFSAAPGTTLLVATLITARDVNLQQVIRNYNDGVRRVVQQQAASGRHIALVEMTEVSAADLSDNLHPNATGFQKMANAWHAGIQRVVQQGWVATPKPVQQTLVGAQSRRCLDAGVGPQGAVPSIYLWDCAGVANQKWTPQPDGSIQAADGKCLDVLNRITSPGAAVSTWGCNGGDNQRWRFHPNGTIVNAQSGLCLDAYLRATDNGSRVSVSTCHGGANQVWNLR